MQEKTVAEASGTMTAESIASYLRHEEEQGGSAGAMSSYRRITAMLYRWLPEDKTLTKARLSDWRQSLRDHGYSPETEQSYIKCVNRYLGYIGRPDLRFSRGRARDLTGKQFGYLTALEPTGERYRSNILWRCRCACGREVEYPATRLLTGNTLSCGCLKGEHIKAVNKYYGGTSLRQSIAEQVVSTRSASGYTGVTKKRDKWKAYIKYKGQNISLGCYTNLEDAVRARARGKELVQADALGLLEYYEQLHKNDPERPSREKIRQMQQSKGPEPPGEPRTRAVRNNNTSGYPGVHRKRDKWAAKITHQKVTYQLGAFERIEDAVAARQAAEQQLREDPALFPGWVLQNRGSGK